MILVIGHLSFTGGEGPGILPEQSFRFASFSDLDGPLLQAVRPDMVVSALIDDNFDAVDMARRLTDLGYAGPYRALSTPLPRPGIVKAEVRGAAPGLDFDLIIVRHDPERPG